MVCESARMYAASQVHKLSKVRDGQHMIDQLHEVEDDLSRQRAKIIAVYDVNGIRRSTDRLGETLRQVFELLTDLEETAMLFGRKSGFGKRVGALVHDIGTNANALLAATSLAIADRPNVLYLADSEDGTPPTDRLEELMKKCLEGDKFFFGRGEKPNLAKAFEAYSWAAERGFPEAMYMLAWMYRSGGARLCQRWLEKAAEKGYAPAMNDLALLFLHEADWLEEQYPEIQANSCDGGDQGRGGGGVPSKLVGREEGGGSGEGEGEGAGAGAGEGPQDQRQHVCSGSGLSSSVEEMEAELGPELLQGFERVMERRRRALRLLQEASKTGHTEAMTNLGNMQEAMGYLDDALDWYR
ncbi:unnamed protein product [Discosporangium mesarthrocarpum]